MQGSVKYADCVNSDMTEAKYWIKLCPSSSNLKMTPAMIKNFNKSNMKKLTGKNVLYDLAGFSDSIESKSYGSYAYAYGICVRRSMLWSDTDSSEPLTAIYVGEPVVILEEKGAWYRVCCVYYEGWINSETIALCNRTEWTRSAGYRRIYDSCSSSLTCGSCNFIVVTGDYITLPHISELSGLRLDMGVVLELTSPNEYFGMYYNYIVKVPSRNPQGRLEYITTGIPISEDVSKGYLDYTGANVLIQAFKTLGNVYGWAGSLYSRDCSSLVMDVHRCFGIIMPRDVSGQMLISEVRSCDSEDILKKLQPGDILGFPGHTMIYAGCAYADCSENVCCCGSNRTDYTGCGQKHYVISATGGKYSSCILNTLCIKRKDGTTWMENVTYGKLPVC